jgi:hypothetical protein
MSDFPDLEFATAPSSAVSPDIDYDRAASAFPDISLDGDSVIPTPYNAFAAPVNIGGGEFNFDDFDSTPRENVTDVKVTGNDAIEKFEDQFPELDVPGPQVRLPSFPSASL